MDFNEYVERGIFYKAGGREGLALDCWGLVRVFYDEQLGIQLPSYEHVNTDLSLLECAKMFEQESFTKWVEVPEPRSGDVVLLKTRRRAMHVGIFIKGGSVLHIEENQMAVIEPLDGWKWQNRVISYIRPKV